jgi:hypothetical protein
MTVQIVHRMGVECVHSIPFRMHKVGCVCIREKKEKFAGLPSLRPGPLQGRSTKLYVFAIAIYKADVLYIQ